MIRLILVEDHVLMREGLKALFNNVDDIEVAAETVSGLELINLLYQNTFDLILMDVSIPGPDSYALVQRIAVYPHHPPILILSMHHESQTAKRMFKLGAKGYITKNSNSAELITAIRKVSTGGKYICSELSEHLFFDSMSASEQVRHEVLTSRQTAILKLLVQGKTVTDIAAELSLSVKTVSAHKINIKQKMHLQSDADLIRYALSNDIV